MDLGTLELGESRLGHHLQRFTGGIGKQVQVQAGHAVDRWLMGGRDRPVETTPHKPRDKAGDNFARSFPTRSPPFDRQDMDMGTRFFTAWG